MSLGLRGSTDLPEPRGETAGTSNSLSPGGLSMQRARQLLTDVGPNRLVSGDARPSLVAWLLRAFADPMVLLLLVAGATYLALGDRFDAVVVLVAVVPIIAVGLLLEARAERALDRLKQLTAPTTTVWRDGHLVVIASEDVIPGDLTSIREGDVVPADGRLVEATQITVDEAALTGESLPVAKDLASVSNERMVFAGTTVVSGRGTFDVTATGPRTRSGRSASSSVRSVPRRRRCSA